MHRYLQISVFAAVAQDLCMTTAARRLEISIPTVTRAMAGLESRLGTVLLERTNKGVTLTEVGRVYAEACARLVLAVEEAEESAKGMHSSVNGHLKLVMPLSFGEHLMTPILLDFLDAWPNVSVSVHYQEHLPNLHEDDLDIAIVVGELPDSSMIALKVGNVRQVVCASPHYLRRYTTPLVPNDLADHRVVQVGSGRDYWLFQATEGQVSIPVCPRLRCPNPQIAVTAALQSTGLVRCLNHQVHHELASGQLVQVLTSYAPPPIPLHLVYREGRRASAKVRSFVECAVARLRIHPALISHS